MYSQKLTNDVILSFESNLLVSILNQWVKIKTVAEFVFYFDQKTVANMVYLL